MRRAKSNLRLDSGEKRTSWFPLEAWGKTAEVLANFARKGQQIGVQGSLRAESYENREGNLRKRLFVRVDRVELLGAREQETDEEVS